MQVDAHGAGNEQVVSPLDDRQPAELATHSARVSARHARSMRAVSNEDDLSSEVIACDRAGSHGQHGSAIMIMAWRSAAPRSCWKCKLEDKLEVERSTFSKSATAVPRAIAVRVVLLSPICRDISISI